MYRSYATASSKLASASSTTTAHAGALSLRLCGCSSILMLASTQADQTQHISSIGDGSQRKPIIFDGRCVCRCAPSTWRRRHCAWVCQPAISVLQPTIESLRVYAHSSEIIWRARFGRTHSHASYHLPSISIDGGRCALMHTCNCRNNKRWRAQWTAYVA